MYRIKVRVKGRRVRWVSYGPPFGSREAAERFVVEMNTAAGSTIEYRIEEEEE